MEEETAFETVLLGGILIIVSALLYGCHEIESTQREAIKAGLVQEVQPGSSQPHWVKPKP